MIKRQKLPFILISGSRYGMCVKEIVLTIPQGHQVHYRIRDFMVIEAKMNIADILFLLEITDIVLMKAIADNTNISVIETSLTSGISFLLFRSYPDGERVTFIIYPSL